MALDPYAFVAGCCATWWRLRLLMVFLSAVLVILLGLSGFEYSSSSGDFATFHLANATANYVDFPTSVCAASPYIYVRPFSFKFQSKSKKFESTSLTNCGWPAQNSSFRLTISVFAIVALAVLFVKTPLSLFARHVLMFFSMMFFAICVLDANADVNGTAGCTSGFAGTAFNADLIRNGITLSCQQSNYDGVVFLDLAVSFAFFFLHSAWGLCNNHYNAESLTLSPV